MVMELTATCRWCGRGPIKAEFSFAPPAPVPYLEQDLFHLNSCENCGAWQVNPYPSPKAAKRFFESAERWLLARDPDNRHVNPIMRSESRRAEYLQYAYAIKPLLPENGAILDVGAGTGLMLSLIDTHHRRIAVEPNKIAAQAATDRGVTVIREWAEDLPPPKVPLAAMILNQALDHLPRPDLFLFRAQTWLAPGGLLLLGGLINPRCLGARIYGPAFRLFHPYHQVYPTPASVERVLKPMGFELVASWRPYFQTPYGSVFKFCSAIGSMGKTLIKPSPGRLSPPFPGNTVSYLARKTVLYKTIKVPEASPSSIPC
ncbi:MAG: class I SAM-dependent methyltransferase [Deltaproteobacteria bacterium]|jgi:SAM-dependent methyltransferase|nr:class I SAM-dependent methyltransferase [Deltaproteobacteria bacterium]